MPRILKKKVKGIIFFLNDIYLCVVSSSKGAVLDCNVNSGLYDSRTPPSRGTNSERYSVTAHGWSLLPTIPYGRCGQRCLLYR